MQKITLRHILSTDWLLLGALCIGLIALKINHLQLLCFWDEAWSYFPALHKMAEQGPSMMPGSIEPELYRGHPLLFYFLASAWMKMVGGVGWWAVRLFPLLLSLALLVSFYFFGKRFFGKKTAAISTALFSLQSVFLAQSSFLLPEVMVALLTVLSVNAYFSGNKWGTCIWLSLLLLTKESGVVLWGTVALFELGKAWKGKYLFKPKEMVGGAWPIAVSALPALLFFIGQKMKLGWFFFPEHIGYLAFDFGDLMQKMKNILAYLFIDMGRNMLTFVGGFSLILIIARKDLIAHKALSIPYFNGFFVFLFLIFSAINFYSPRYLLCALPFTIISFVYLIEKAIESFNLSKFQKLGKILPVMLLLALFTNNLFFTFGKIKGNDHNLGFAQAVKTHQAVVAFLEANTAPDQRIATGFLTKTNLTNTELGYLQGGKPLTNLTGAVDESTDFAVLTSTEMDNEFLNSIKAHQGKLLKRFEVGKAWSEVYGFEGLHGE